MDRRRFLPTSVAGAFAAPLPAREQAKLYRAAFLGSTSPSGYASQMKAFRGGLRPGGNVTGLSFFVLELNAKRLELLKEAVPRLDRVGILLKRDNPANGPVLRAMEDAAQTLKLQLQPIGVRDPADLENAVSALESRERRAPSPCRRRRC